MIDSTKGRFAILISGTGSNMLALLEGAREGKLKATPAVVISNVSSAPGLGKAASQGVETLVIDHRESPTREAHDLRIVEALQRRDVGLVCLAGYMRVLSPVFLRAFRGRVLNIHPALLPAFPGLHAQKQALEYGVKVSGCTVHFVDEGVDTGPIVIQSTVVVSDADTEESLTARILTEEHRIYREAVRLFFEDRLRVRGRRVQVLPQVRGI